MTFKLIVLSLKNFNNCENFLIIGFIPSFCRNYLFKKVTRYYQAILELKNFRSKFKFLKPTKQEYSFFKINYQSILLIKQPNVFFQTKYDILN